MTFRPLRRCRSLALSVAIAVLGFLIPNTAHADTSERVDHSLFGSISSGAGNTCAVTSTSAVKCWGLNHVGQLGDGTQTDSWIPVQVQGLSAAVESAIATPYNGCAVESGGAVKCWGNNSRGQLGIGSTNTTPNIATQVSGLTSGVKALTGSEFAACALLHNGEVKCWGEFEFDFNNDGVDDPSNSPVTIPGLPQDIVAISSGGGKFYCVVSASTGVWCWGVNTQGQLADGTNINRLTPVRSTNLNAPIKSLSSGAGHSCVVTNTGGVKCWGSNLRGKLGDGTQTHSSIPIDVVGLSGPAIAVSASYHHTCALLQSGAVQCWGWNAAGQLGNGNTTDSNTPVSVQGLTSPIEALTTGSRNTCVLLSNGELKCWGDNTYGQLGDGTDTNRLLPASVSNFTGATTTTSTTTSSTTTTQTPIVTTTTVPRNQFVSSGTTTTTTLNGNSLQLLSLPSAGQKSSRIMLVAMLAICAGLGLVYRRTRATHRRVLRRRLSRQ